jgi:hypothetical protein
MSRKYLFAQRRLFSPRWLGLPPSRLPRLRPTPVEVEVFVKDDVHVHDFHATMLHLLGIDHERLTYKFQGRRYRLTDVHGKIVKGILA